MKQEIGPRPKTHELYVKKEIFPHIESGEKKYEVRINELDAAKDRYQIQAIRAGDSIIFSDGAHNTVTRQVINITKCHSMEEFLEGVDENDVMPGMPYEEILEKWQKLTHGREKGLGIVVFELK